MECVLEVQYTIGAGLYSLLLVQSGLPVERRLHGVLYGQCPTSYEEEVPKRIGNCRAPEGIDECRVLA